MERVTFCSREITIDSKGDTSTESWRLVRFSDTRVQLSSSSSYCLLSISPPFQWPPADRNVSAIKALIGILPDSDGRELVENVLRDVFCVEKDWDPTRVTDWIEKRWRIPAATLNAVTDVVKTTFEKVCQLYSSIDCRKRRLRLKNHPKL